MSVSLVLNLHAPGNYVPHTFDETPKSIFVGLRVQTVAPVEGEKFPTPEVDITVAHFVNLSSLSPELQQAVRKELFPGKLPVVISEKENPLFVVKTNPSRNLSPAVNLSAGVGDKLPQTSTEPKVITHENLDSFISSIADSRAVPGDLLPCDNPRKLRLGYVHHPEEGEPLVHEIPLKNVKASAVSEEVASRLNLTPEEVREYLGTYEGRYFLFTGKKEEQTTPEQDAELERAMLSSPVKVDFKIDSETDKLEVEFPEVDLFRDVTEPLVKVVTEKNNNFGSRPYAPRPDWVPAGWSYLSLPEDADRLVVLDDASPEGSKGAFARKADLLFRAFEDGRWDISQWVSPLLDNRNQQISPGGYKVFRAGFVGNPDIHAALNNVIPEYEKTPSALVRI